MVPIIIYFMYVEIATENEITNETILITNQK